MLANDVTLLSFDCSMFTMTEGIRVEFGNRHGDKMSDEKKSLIAGSISGA